MSTNYKQGNTASMYDQITGAYIGQLGLQGQNNFAAVYATNLNTGLVTGLVEPDGSVFPLSTPTTALRPVATRGITANQGFNSLNYCNSRSTHYLRDSVDKLKIVVPTFKVRDGLEAGMGTTTSLTASIEYPAGTYTQVAFGGLNNPQVADKTYVESDWVNLSIKKNDKMYVRIWRYGVGGVVYTESYIVHPDDKFEISGSVLTDKTMGGSIPSGYQYGFQPIAIVGYSEKCGLVYDGDSIGHGQADNGSDCFGDNGFIARSITRTAGYMGLASPGDSWLNFSNPVNSALRRALINAYGTDVIHQMGTNDLGAYSSSAATMLSNLAATIALMPNQRHYLCTIPPRTTSSDSWVTTAGQTVTAWEAQRVLANNSIRLGVSGISGVFDVADRLETSRNSGIFAIDTNSANPAMTPDGVHPARNANQLVARSGTIRAYEFIGHY